MIFKRSNFKNLFQLLWDDKIYYKTGSYQINNLNDEHTIQTVPKKEKLKLSTPKQRFCRNPPAKLNFCPRNYQIYLILVLLRSENFAVDNLFLKDFSLETKSVWVHTERVVKKDNLTVTLKKTTGGENREGRNNKHFLFFYVFWTEE